MPPALALLPIETRAARPVAGWPCASATNLARGAAGPAQPPRWPGAAGRHAHPACQRGTRPRRWASGATSSPRQPAAGRRRHGRGAGLAPCLINYPHPLLQARPGGHRHAGAQRHRRRARADAGPAADGARGGVSCWRPTPASPSPTWPSGATTWADRSLERFVVLNKIDTLPTRCFRRRGGRRRSNISARRDAATTLGVPTDRVFACRRAGAGRALSGSAGSLEAQQPAAAGRRAVAACCRASANCWPPTPSAWSTACARWPRGASATEAPPPGRADARTAGLRGKSGGKVRVMLQRVDAESAEFERCIARLQAVRSVQQRMLKGAGTHLQPGAALRGHGHAVGAGGPPVQPGRQGGVPDAVRSPGRAAGRAEAGRRDPRDAGRQFPCS
jgi:hypothetical protein